MPFLKSNLIRFAQFTLKDRYSAGCLFVIITRTLAIATWWGLLWSLQWQWIWKWHECYISNRDLSRNEILKLYSCTAPVVSYHSRLQAVLNYMSGIIYIYIYLPKFSSTNLSISRKNRHDPISLELLCGEISLLKASLPKTNQNAPENRPLQKETSLPTIHFQRKC